MVCLESRGTVDWPRSWITAQPHRANTAHCLHSLLLDCKKPSPLNMDCAVSMTTIAIASVFSKWRRGFKWVRITSSHMFFCIQERQVGDSKLMKDLSNVDLSGRCGEWACWVNSLVKSGFWCFSYAVWPTQSAVNNTKCSLYMNIDTLRMNQNNSINNSYMNWIALKKVGALNNRDKYCKLMKHTTAENILRYGNHDSKWIMSHNPFHSPFTSNNANLHNQTQNL